MSAFGTADVHHEWAQTPMIQEVENMPWTPQTPYIAHLFAQENDQPEEMFYETAGQPEQEIEKHKKTGLYARIWSGHGKSANRNEWQESAEWERGD
jgi:hypothetical protein